MAAPKWMNKNGRVLWNKIKPTEDQQAFELLCHAYGVFKETEETLQKDGRYIMAGTGRKYLHPACALQKQAYDMFARMYSTLKNIKTTEKLDDTLEAFLSDA